MRLIEIGKNRNDYINADFVTRVWKDKNEYYCEILSKTVYQIDKNAYMEFFLKYDKTRI